MRPQPWLDNWQIVSDMPGAAGGQGQPYRVRRRGAKDEHGQFVLKVLKAQRNMDRRRRMWTEVAALQAVAGDGVCQYIDSNADQWRTEIPLYLVTEFVPGPTLGQFAFGKPMMLEPAVRVMGSILQTVGRCHRIPVVHRDIKPDNVILRDGDPGLPVLLDFGLSFNAEQEEHGVETASGQHLGNRFLLLPELTAREGDKRDPATDITQCVGIFFFLLVGRYPDALVDERNRPPHKRDAAAAALERFDEPVRRQLGRIFDVGFRIERSTRWQSAEELFREIQVCLAPPAVPPETLVEAFRRMKAETGADPDRARLALVDSLTRAASDLIRDGTNQLNNELQNQIGLSFNSAGQGPVGKTFCQFSAHDALLRRSLGTVEVAVRVEETRLVVSVAAGGSTRDIGSVGIHDPEAQGRVSEAIQNALKYLASALLLSARQTAIQPS